MSEPNNGHNQLPPRPQTKAEVVAQREQVRMLGIALGNWREAARRCGLSEGRVLNWVVRYGWKLPKRIEAPHPRGVLSPVVGIVSPAQSLEERLKQDAEATRVGLSAATRKASVSLAGRDGAEVVYISARLKDVVSSAAQLHGWNQPASVNVNIANIPLPTEEERAETREIDRKLDAFAAMLREPNGKVTLGCRVRSSLCLPALPTKSITTAFGFALCAIASLRPTGTVNNCLPPSTYPGNGRITRPNRWV